VGGYLRWLDLSTAPWWGYLLGIWEGWRGGWVFMGAALWLARPGRERLLLGGGALAVLLAGLLTAQDFSRSMMFLTPLVALGAVRLVEAVPRWLPLLAAAALLLPAHLVMSEGTARVMPLKHELANLDDPPERARADYYELQGVREMERGQPVSAEHYLTLAIKLADNPTSAAKHRGMLRASLQRWADAESDFHLMIEREPQDPEGWLLHAQSLAATGDIAGAKAEMQEALAVAPKGWAKRSDVVIFRQRLDSAK
jgi:tetratricopeptide (TPR) repeat protein